MIKEKFITIRIAENSYHGKRIAELSIKYGVSLNAASKIYLEDLNAIANLKESAEVPSRHTHKVTQPTHQAKPIVEIQSSRPNQTISAEELKRVTTPPKVTEEPPKRKSLLSEGDLDKVKTGTGIIDSLKNNLF